MKSLDFGRYVLGGFAFAAMLTGCGGTQPPIGVPGTMSQSRIREVPSSYGDLLYAADISGVIYVLSYPEGQLVEKIEGEPLPGTLCSDTNGDVFVPDGSELLEYAHGGTEPIATLQTENGYGAYGCSVDPTTGNLAVTANHTGSRGPGNVEIFEDARGAPTIYSDSSAFTYYFCGYDDNGDLFVVINGGLVELPQGSSAFTGVLLTKVGAGEVQWDGKYITNDNGSSKVIDRIAVSGSEGKIVGKTILRGPRRPSQSWIYGNTAIAPLGKLSNNVGLFNYPAGRKPYKTIQLGSEARIFGVTVSVGPSR